MTRAQFLNNIEHTFTEGVELVRKKNLDYASGEDPFMNFKNSEIAKVSAERGILIRVIDKISRISNLLDRPEVVIDETIKDSILDAINYLAILKAKLEDKSI